MDKYKLILSKNSSGKFVGIVLRNGKLIANSLPTSERKAYSLINSIADDLSVEKVLNLINHPVTELIFNLDTNPTEFWDKALNLEIDYYLFTESQKKVMKTLRRTDPGEVISYRDLALRSGIPNGARFVGNCMAYNKMPLIVPCHRVIKSDGTIGQYSGDGGVERKKRYLSLESSEIIK